MEKQVQDDGSTFEENIKFRLYLAMVLLGLLEFSRPIIGGKINAISITDIAIGNVLIIVGIIYVLFVSWHIVWLSCIR